MSLEIIQGFKVSKAEPVDTKLRLSKEEMLNIDENTMPAQYFCVCSDDGKMYTYDVNNSIDPETGKFRIVGDDSEQIGDLTTLQTENKSDLVSAINELFQASSNIKQDLVDALTGKGFEASTEDSMSDIIQTIIDNLSPSDLDGFLITREGFNLVTIDGAKLGYKLPE